MFEPWASPAIATQEREGPVYWNRTYACVAWVDTRNRATTGYDIYYSTPGATYTIATNPSGEGLKVQVDGVNYTNSRSFNWPAGYAHDISAPSPQKESVYIFQRYAFTRWSDDGPQSHSILVGTTDLTITANYIKQYKITFEVTTAGPSHTDLNSTNYVTVVYRSCEAFLNVYVWDASPAIVWVDEGSIASYILQSSGSTATHRWYAPTNPSYTITGPATYNPTIWDQYKPLISAAVGGSGYDLNSTNYVELTYYQFGSVGTFNVFEGNDYNDWVDAGSTASLSNPSQESTPTHRWFSSGPVSWAINDASTRIAIYYEQFKFTVTSDHDTPVPSVGDHWIDQDESVTASVTSPADETDDTRYRCTGWTGTGSVPATGTEPSVTFTMTEPSTIIWEWIPQYQITFTESGPETGRSVTITVNGESHSGTTIYDYSEWFDEDLSVEFGITDQIDSATPGTRYVFVNWKNDAGSVITSPQTISAPDTFTAQYETQYQFQLTIDNGGHGITTPTSGNWYDAGEWVTITMSSDTTSNTTDTICFFDSWTGTGLGSYTGLENPCEVQMNEPITEVANWIVQYRVVFTESGIESGLNIWIMVNGVTHDGNTIYNYTEWFDEGSSVTFNIRPQWRLPPDVTWPHTIYDLVEWKNAAGSVITSPQTILAPDTFTAHYTTQYRLEVDSPHGTTGGTDYYYKGSTAYATLNTNNVSGGYEIQYVFTEWSGDASGTDYSQSDPIIMDCPKTAIANWKTQYHLTIDINFRPIDVPATIPGEGWYDEGASVTLTAPSSIPISDDARYRFDYWKIHENIFPWETSTSTDNPITFNMENPKELAAIYVAQFKFTVVSEFGSPVPSAGEHWYDRDTYINASVTTISGEFDGTRYSLEGWTGTGRCTPYSADSWTDTWVYFSLSNMPSSIQWNWRVQYYLTIETDPTDLSPQPTVSPTGLWYDSGTQVNLTAETINGYNFDHWDIDGTAQDPGANPTSLTMDAPHTATAHYTTAAPAFPLWWLVIIIAIIAAATVTFILARKKILRPKTTTKPKPSK